MRVLLIEGDAPTSRVLELTLQSERFNVYPTDLAEEGVDLAKIYEYDLILLDWSISDMSALRAIKSIREARVTTPIVVLARQPSVPDLTAAFNAGADDWIVKPVHADELVSRIRAVARRAKGHASIVITIGPIAVNMDAKTVEVNGKRVKLTGKEYAIVELLALRKETTVSKAQFLNHLYGGMDEPEIKIIDVFICKVRKKLADAAGGAQHIETSWGTGYRFTEKPVKKLFATK